MKIRCSDELSFSTESLFNRLGLHIKSKIMEELSQQTRYLLKRLITFLLS